MKIDILAFAPHPDDAELYCSGTILAAKHAGQRTGIVDLTRGELSTRGNPELRSRETAAASAILQIDLRRNLNIPDGNIELSAANRWKVVETLRTFTPDIVLLPYFEDRHPDHQHASKLVQEALFYSGIGKWQEGGSSLAPHRPRRAYYYMLAEDFQPDILVDISQYFETKIASIQAYASQFHSEEYRSDEPSTFISTEGFMAALAARSRRLGFLAGGHHAEGLKMLTPLALSGEQLVSI